MKAVEWIKKFNETPDAEEAKKTFLDGFGDETADLVAKRTSGSNFVTRLNAGEGAVREQRQKFQKIKGTLTWLRDADFENMVSESCDEYRSWEDNARKRAEEAVKAQEAKEKKEKEAAGRAFAKEGEGNKQPQQHKQKQHNRKPFHERQQGGERKAIPHPQRIGDLPAEYR